MAVKKGPLGEEMVLVSVTENRLSALKRLRARLSAEIDITGDQRSLCLLTTQLRAVMAEIDELAVPEISAADEIRRRREQRRSKGLPVSIDHSAGRGGGRDHG